MKRSIIASSIKSQAGCLLLLVLLPMAVYFNSLQGSFQFDDQDLLEQPWLSDFAHYKDEVSFFPSSTSLLDALNLRSVLLLTFAVNNSLHFNRVFGFHLTSLLLHVWVTILIFAIVRVSKEFMDANLSRSVKRQPEPAPNSKASGYHPRTLALIASLLFALHPLATDSVSYISSRSTLLASFFYLLSLWMFLRIFTLRVSPYRRVFQMFLAGIIFAFYYLALASKLTAITLPVLLAVWFIFIISPARFPKGHVFLLSRVMILTYVLLLIIPLKMALGFVPRDAGTALYGNLGYFLTQLKVIVFYYLRMFFFPINQNVDIGFPFFNGTDPQLFLAIVILSGLLVWVLRKGSLLLKAATAWFFLTLAPSSSFVPLNDLAVEHRLYLSMSLGLCLIAGQGLAGMTPRRRLGILLVLVIAAGVLTTARNQVWLNEMTLWQDAVKKSPRSPRPYVNIGKAYYYKDKTELAMESFRKSISLYPQFAAAHTNLANIYMDLNRLKEAEEGYQTAIRSDAKYFAAYLGLGSVYNQTGRYEEAIETYNQANDAWKLNKPGEYALAKQNLGEVYGNVGRFEDSIKASNLALKFSPSMFKAHFNLGTAYMKLGDLENAERSLLNCLKIDNRFEKAQFNLAHLFQLKKEWERSNEWFEKFLQTKGPDARAYFGIGWNFQQMQRWQQSQSFFEKSLTVRPDYFKARINLANVHIQLKQFDEALVHFGQVLEKQPDQFQVHLQMGIIYWKIKSDKIKAGNHFKQALELAPRTQEKTQVSQLIKALAKS